MVENEDNGEYEGWLRGRINKNHFSFCGTYTTPILSLNFEANKLDKKINPPEVWCDPYQTRPIGNGGYGSISTI